MSPSSPLRTVAPTETALVDTVRRLIECESPSADDEAVARSADVVEDVGTALLGVAPERIIVDGCTHLRWRFGVVTRVLLLAHHDTVWPVGTLTRLPFSVQDGVMRGPGSFDMKTGLAMMLHAIAALDDREGVTLLVTGDEETGSRRSRALIEETARGASAALVAEASEQGAWKAARKGVAMYEFVVHGRAAHAGLEPERGVNATIALAHLALAATALSDPGTGTTVTPTRADAGTTGNTVPAEARLFVDVRAWSLAELERVDAALRSHISPVPEARLTVHGGSTALRWSGRCRRGWCGSPSGWARRTASAGWPRSRWAARATAISRRASGCPRSTGWARSAEGRMPRTSTPWWSSSFHGRCCSPI